MRFKIGSMLAFSAIALPAMLSAQTTLYANLTNSQEVPPVISLTTSTGAPRPVSFGNAIFEINAAQTAMTFTAWIYNIDITGAQTPNDANDNLTNAHIHGPAFPGSNAGVIWGFLGTPDNDNNPDNLVVSPFANSVGGMISSTWNLPEGNGGTTLAAQLDNIMTGQTYMNIHTVQFGGGEIRGQIVTPEPSTFLLTAAGLGAAAFAVKRRRRQS